MVEQISDFKIPEKVVARLLREALPEDIILSNDARNAAARSASIFILQLSIVAAEKAAENNRRHLENQDIIKAVTDLGLGEYAPQLVRFGAQRKRNAKRKETSMMRFKTKKPCLEGSEMLDSYEPIDNDRELIDPHDQPSASEDEGTTGEIKWS